MYSLALLVLILMSILLFSGPIALILTTQKIKKLSDSRSYLLIRRSFLGALSLFGILVSLFTIIGAAPLSIKFIGALSLTAHYFSIDREYDRVISSKFRRGKNGQAGQS
jgi:hypothetical protein